MAGKGGTRACRTRGWIPCVLAVSTLCVMLLSSTSTSFMQQQQPLHATEVQPLSSRAVPKVALGSGTPVQAAGEGANAMAAVLLCTVAAAAVGKLHALRRPMNSSRAKKCRIQLAAMPPAPCMTAASAIAATPAAVEPAAMISLDEVIIQSPLSIPVFSMDVPAVAPAAVLSPAPLVDAANWSRPRGKPQASRRVGGARQAQRRRRATARQAEAQERAEHRSVGSRLGLQEQPIFTPEVTPSFDASKIRYPIQAGICLSARSGVRSSHERRRRHGGTSTSACDSMLGLTATSCLRIEAPKYRHRLNDTIKLSPSIGGNCIACLQHL
mmetsp:Transcript_7417/g.13207  ORF Transcript_7417/g.13207 Transcript_7417/m.13207 type:complete len:326 (-) Transcript_7417:7-984(-)